MSLKSFTYNLILFCFFLFKISLLHAREISFNCSDDCSELESFLPSKLFIQTVDIQADYQVDKDELLYLIDIAPMSYVLSKDIVQTVFYLKKKESFSKIEICFDGEENKLTFKLEGLFIISSLQLHGSMIGKEKYKSLYIMDIGECFDQSKHDLSLRKIKNNFFQAGFFQASIQDELSFDPVSKMVKVDLFLSKGAQFSIGDCSFDIRSVDNVDEKDMELMKAQLARIFIKRLYTHKYTKDMITKSMIHFKRYLEKQGFSQTVMSYEESIDYENRQVDLKFYFSCDEKKEFVFWGNHFFTQENFLENILIYGKSSWHFPSAIISDEIESMYKSKGYWDVKVSVKEEKGKTYCIIHEGKRAMITKVECKDNFNISLSQLQKECFSSLHNKYFDRDLYTQSLHKLKQFYMKHGYWSIQIVKEEFVRLKESSDNKTIDYKVVLTLDEGDMKLINSVCIKGFPELLEHKPFLKFATIKEPIPFNYNWIAEQKNWLYVYFKELGHTKVVVDYEYHNNEKSVDLIWTISLDEKQVYFGKFVIQGNSRIPFKHLRRELDIKQGDIWNKKKIDKSMENLRNLNLFDTVYIYSHKEIDEQGQIPVGVKLVAADTYEVRTRIGGQQVGKDFSLQQGFSYKFGGTFLFNNPFKYGDRIIAEADFTRFYGNLSVQYLMPWLFNRPIRSKIKVYDNSYLQPLYIGSDVSIYSAYQKGILFGMQEKHDHSNFGMTLGVEFKGIKPADIKDIALSIDYDSTLLHKQFAYVFFEPSLMLNYVDNILNPKQGWSGFISCLGMGDIVERTSFFKFLAEYSLYVPFTNKTVFAVRSRIGHVFNQEYEYLMPIDRFYLGGANTIRGYDRDYCPPLGLLTKPVPAPDTGLPLAANDLWSYVNQGGRTMFNCNFEIRFPIYGPIEGATFLDTGVLIKDSVAEIPNNLLGGGGFGFRYNTPIGPLRFDIAFKLDIKHPEFESPYVWYLTLGQAF